MPRMWDEKKEQELEAALQAKDDALAEVSAKLGDAFESDSEWDAAKSEEYSRNQLHHGQLTRERKVIADDLEAMSYWKDKSKLPAVEENAELADLEAFLRGRKDGNGDSTVEGNDRSDKRKHSFSLGLISDRQRAQMLTRSDNSSGSGATEVRTQPTVIDSLAAFGNGMNLPSMIMTNDGNSMSFPVTDNSTAEGEMLADEGTTAASQDLGNISTVALTVKRFSSKQMPISNTMISDSVFDIVGYALTQSTRRLGRIISKKAVSGAGGANDIEGIVNKAKVHTLSSRTAYAFVDDSVDMITAIQRAYLQGEGGFGAGVVAGSGLTSKNGFTGFAVSYELAAALMKAKESDSGRPIWQPAVESNGWQDRLFGYPVMIVDELGVSGSHDANGNPIRAALGTQNAKHILFGNMNYFCGRLVGDMSISQFYDSGTAPGATSP